MPQVHRRSTIGAAVLSVAVFTLLLLSVAVPAAPAQQERFPVPVEIYEKLNPQERATLLATIATPGTGNFWLMVIFLLFVGALIAGLFIYIHRLHANFLKICTDNQQVAAFAQAPADLPIGTIRGAKSARWLCLR